MEEFKYGILINDDIKLHRNYFKEMCNLIGIKVNYLAPKDGKHYTTNAEIISNYDKPILTSCIFDEHPTQKTLKKMGWISELQDNSSIIHVLYDLPKLQQGALFVLPSGLDNTKGRVFRVVTISNIMVYPASIACEIVPEFYDTYQNSQNDFSQSSFNLLRGEEGY